MPPSQDDIFRASEGDAWFRRNQAALMKFDPDKDNSIRLMEMYGIKPVSVLEVGACNGFRLESIRLRFSARVAGVEPSAEALKDGAGKFPHVRLSLGSAAAIPFRETFDVVLASFVFHWIDRSTLMRSAAEVDRVLEDGGFLLLSDFLPFRPLQVPYHHLEGQEVYTYKQDYAQLFLASGIYTQVALFTGNHASHAPDAKAPEDDRIATWLLRKDVGGSYLRRTLRRGNP